MRDERALLRLSLPVDEASADSGDAYAQWDAPDSAPMQLLLGEVVADGANGTAGSWDAATPSDAAPPCRSRWRAESVGLNGSVLAAAAQGRAMHRAPLHLSSASASSASAASSASFSVVVVRPRHRDKHGRLRGIEDRHEARRGGEAPPQHLERLGTLTLSRRCGLGRAGAEGGALVQNVAEGQGEGGAIVLQVDVVPGTAPAPGEGEQRKETDDEEGHPRKAIATRAAMVQVQ